MFDSLFDTPLPTAGVVIIGFAIDHGVLWLGGCVDGGQRFENLLRCLEDHIR